MNEPDIAAALGKIGYSLKKSRNSEEMHANCPKCADPSGCDRLIIFSDGNAYCRRCETFWTPYKFVREFLCYDAAQKLAKSSHWGMKKKEQIYERALRVMPDTIPSQKWSFFMEELADRSAENLHKYSWAVNELLRRGLSSDFACTFGVGYNDKDLFVEGRVLDLNRPYVFIPQGLIIFYDKEIDGKVRCIKAKVRKQKNDDGLPKYIQIPGSANQPMVLGYFSEKIPLIVESEFDALVCLQEASPLIWTVGLGGASKPIDWETDLLLQKSSCILWSLDQDEAGRDRFRFWKNKYPQLRAWPADRAKSPGDMPARSLYDWILRGIERCKMAA